MPAQPLKFNLSLQDDNDDEGSTTQRLDDSDNRLMEMLATQAAHREDRSAAGNEDSIARDGNLTEDQKRALLQKSLQNAASNGDVERVENLLHGTANKYIDVNAPDEEGTAPLIYASCFVGIALSGLRTVVLISIVGPRGRSSSLT
jgi:hypothetical protein